MKQVLQNKSQAEYLRILGKGMVTIPKAWRDELGLEESSIIKAQKVGDRIIIESETKFAPFRTFSIKEIQEWLEEDKMDENNDKQIKRTGSVVEQTAGALKGRGKPLSARELRRVTEEEVAKEVVDRMGV